MPRLTFPIAADGLRLPVVLDLETTAKQAMLAKGLPLPAPISADGLVDTGTTITAVVPRLLPHLGVVPSASGQSQSVTGIANLQFYKIALTIYDPATSPPATLHYPSRIVTDLPQDLTDVDVLIGLDILRTVSLEVNGPGGWFSLSF